MRISEVIRRKQDPGIVTIRPGDSVSDLLDLLEQHRIGAAVVSEDGATAAGIVSERDIVRHLHSQGAGLLTARVSTIMTSEVQTCTPDDDLDTLARQMTEHRIRHVPVVKEGTLYSIVSIGDIVKNRIDELQEERDQLVGYIQQ